MRWIIAALVFAASAFGAHYFTIRAVPGFIMNKVQSTFETQGLPLNRFVASPRQTPETQRIVRPSPDLSYAICRFDVRDGPVLISAPGWDGYGSLSVFDDQTNNVFVANLDGEDANVVLLNLRDKGMSMDDMPEGAQSVFLKDAGITLIRRLAPTDEAHERSADLITQARCVSRPE